MFSSSLSRSSVDASSMSSTASVVAAMAGASVFENRYGRLRWRSSSTISRRPLVKPPDAPPSALPSVLVTTSTRSMTPWYSGVPRPVGP